MSMPRAVRHINEVRILDALYRHGSTTRADLARELGLMRSTVGNLVTGLIEQGLLSEGAVVDPAGGGRAGRPGQLVQLNARTQAFIGADIGVGHLSVVAINLLGQVIHSRTVACQPSPGAVESVLAPLSTLIRDAVRSLPQDQTVHGLCVTVPGLVDDQGVVLRAPILGWSNVDVLPRLAAALNWQAPMTAENDANAFAAAELYGRDPSPSANALFVYLDAGVGGGMTSRGDLLRGDRGRAGEIGHIHLGEQGFDPDTALQGSFESYVARNAVLARWIRHGGPENGRLEDFVGAVHAGQPAAARTLDEWAWWMGRGLASLISVLDPGRVVLGGPVAALYALAKHTVDDAISRHLVAPPTLPRMEISALGANACAIGGALLLHHAHLAVDESLIYGGGPNNA
jgi:predicted NBD/HSP70 family sugar kinase